MKLTHVFPSGLRKWLDPQYVGSRLWTSRPGMAVAILLGRPVAYRMTFDPFVQDGSVTVLEDGAIFNRCMFLRHQDDAPALAFRRRPS